MNASDILMGFVDLIPVAAFLVAAIMLQRTLYNKVSKGAFAVFSAGTIIVFVAGLLKAIYKILLTFRICAFVPLSQQFFPMQTVGFFLAGAAVMAILCHHQGEHTVHCIAAPAVVGGLVLAYQGDYSDLLANPYGGTMIFVAFMCLGVVVFDGGLAFICAKNKCWVGMALLIVSLVFTLGMGYLSTKDAMNDWIKEFVNSVGQVSLLVAAYLMKKKGLDKPEVNVTFFAK